MFKKILLITTLCISLMALMGTSANAAPPFPGGWAWWPGSVNCYSTWKSVSPWLLEEEYDFEIECTARALEVEVVCVNHGGQIGGSFRFHPEVDLATTDKVEIPEIEKGGKVESEGTISDLEWYNELFCVDEDCDEYDFSQACHNRNNWTVLRPGDVVDGVEGYVKVTRLHGRIRGYLSNWGVTGDVIGQIEARGDLNEKGDKYIWDYTYIWSLKKDELPMIYCDWCIDIIP